MTEDCTRCGGSGSLSDMTCCPACGGGGIVMKLRTPKGLDTIVDTVLAYRPKPKSKPARRRKRRAAKIAKAK